MPQQQARVTSLLLVASVSSVASDVWAAYARDGVAYPLQVLDAIEQRKYAVHFDALEANQTGMRFAMIDTAMYVKSA